MVCGNALPGNEIEEVDLLPPPPPYMSEIPPVGEIPENYEMEIVQSTLPDLLENTKTAKLQTTTEIGRANDSSSDLSRILAALLIKRPRIYYDEEEDDWVKSWDYDDDNDLR
jgi:hypothetical protein